VFSNDYRHPLVLAKEAATLDVLSGGRLELGLGTGFESREYEQTGLSLDSPSVRAERLGEGVQIIKKAFAGGPFTFTGSSYSVTDFESFPPSLQQPHPPLLIGGGRGQLLSIAAKEADIVGLQMSSTAHGVHSNPARLRLAETVLEKVRLLEKTAGDRFGHLELSIVATVRITSHRVTAAEQFAADRNWTELSSQQVLDMPSVLIGSAEEITDEIRRRRERYAISYYVVSDRSMDAVTPIVNRLSGQ
jgi:probable F420-dependent oxidoreductase